MALEIERKFLVKSQDFKLEEHTKHYIKQGFLNSAKQRVVRVRIKNNQGFLTIKGKSNSSGTSRFEWEKEIEKTDAIDLLALCEPNIIEKFRYEIQCNNHIFEVDVFLGVNKGLIIAEVELNSEDESFSKPNWLGKEVTGDQKYYNSNLSKDPYNTWK